MSQGKIKNLIFDLGGVIINLDTFLTIRAFADITGQSPEAIIKFSTSHPHFHAYEKGEIDNATFRDTIREMSTMALEDEVIDKAWNAMILDLPHNRIDLLKKLKNSYNIYLLSNTNTIHMECVNNVRAVAGIISFDQIFHQDYYSHLMGKRKPDSEIFDQVLEDNNLSAEETLFLDDNYDNIKGASNLGINTLHVTSPNLLFEYFDER